MKKNSIESSALDESSYKDLFSHMINGFALHKIIVNKKGQPIDYEFLEVNPAFEKMTGLKRENIIGKKVTIIIPGTEKDPADWIGKYGKVALTGKNIQFENYSEGLKKWFNITAYSSQKGYFVTIFEDITEKRNHVVELLSQKRFLESLAQMSHDITYIYDIIDKKNVYVSEGIQKVLGYPIAEIQKMGDKLLPILMHPDDMQHYLKEIIPRYAKAKYNEIIKNEYRMKHRNGSWIWLECSEQIYQRQPNGAPQQIFGVIHDITERKKTENMIKDSEERYKTLFNSSNDAVFVHYLKADGTPSNFINVNETACKTYGYSKEELLKLSLLDLNDPKAFRERGISAIKKILKEGKATFETINITKKGERIPVEISSALFEVDDKKATLSIVRNITERKKIEEELNKSKLLLTSSIDCQKDTLIFSLDKNYNYLYFNKTHSDVMKYAYNKDVKIGMNILKCITSDDDRKQAKKNYDLALHGKSHSNIRIYGDINKSYYESFFNPIKNDKGEIIGVTGLARDITERKQAEKKLSESETLFKQIFENMSSGVVIYEVQDNGKGFIIKNCNKTAENWEKIRREDVIGKNVLKVFPGIVQFGLYDVLKDVWKTGKSKKHPITLYQDNRNFGWRENYVFKLSDNEIVTIYNDVTERKKEEEKLKESEEKYKLLVDRMQEVTIIVDKTGKILFANKFTLDTTGYTEKEMFGKSVFSFLTKRSVKIATHSLTQEFLGQIMDPIEVEIITKKGEIRTIALSEASNPIYKDGKVVQLLINGIDITEQKKAEELNKNIIECTTDWIWEVNTQGKYIYCSENVKEILGYDSKEVIGKTPFDFMLKEEVKRIGPIFEEIIKKQHPIKDLENWNIHKKGHKVCLLTNGFPIFDTEGKWKGYRGADKDITERKNAEEDIITSKKLLQRIIDLLPIRVFWKDKNLKFLGCNEIFAKDAGKKTYTDLIGKDDFQMVWKEQAKVYRDDDAKIIKSGKSRIDYEEPQTTPKGDTIWLKTSKIPLTDIKGDSIGILGTYEDITERKKIETALKDSEEKYRAILNYSTDQIFMVDSNLKYISVGQSLAESLGRKPEDMINKSIIDIFGKSDQKARFIENITEVFKNKESKIIEEEIILRGEKNFISTQLSSVKDVSGKIIAVLGIVRNNTGSKKAEEELTKSQGELKAKLEEVEKFNKMTVGRELRMIELKEKIKELEDKLNKKKAEN